MRVTQLRQADLNLLIVFTVFAEERNVSRAAERLLLSQPAVSRALGRLRDMFHDDLFVRASGSYELTPQGQRLLKELESMLPKLDRLLSGTSFDPSTEDASFRIAVSDYAASVLVPPFCRSVLPSAQKVKFEFIPWHGGTFEEVRHGSVDLTFAANVVDAPPPLQSQTIFDEEFVCVVDARHPLKRAPTLDQYLRSEHVSVSIRDGLQVTPDKPLAMMGYTRRCAIFVPYHETAIRCVQGTQLVATIPKLLMADVGAASRVRVLKAPREIRSFRYVMTWHPRVNTDAAHTWLRATMRRIGADLQDPHREQSHR
jgi:DNA-binding transcriptional LysR family regulator